MSRVARDFGAASALYDQHVLVQEDVLLEASRLLNAHVGRQSHVLDVGCGTGRLAQYCDAQLRGCDIAEGMCAQAPYPADIANAEALPYVDASMDATFSSLVLQWVEDKAQAFAEMYRVTKAGGACVVATLGPNTLEGLDRLHIPRLMFESREAYCHYASEAGWRIAEARSEMLRYEHETLLEALRQIKAVGARHKEQRGRLSRARLMQPFTAEWDMILLELHKPAQ